MTTQTQILIKRDSVSGTVPTTASIASGELAMNLPDGILYSTNGSVVFPIGANLVNQSVTNSVSIGNTTVNSTINSTSVHVGNSSVYTIANTSGITTTGNITVTEGVYANNLLYCLPWQTANTTTNWIKLGSFNYSPKTHLGLKVVSAANANFDSISIDSETYIHFKTAGLTSNDVNGFAGEFTYYTVGQSPSVTNVAVVSDAPGNTATSFSVYFYLPGNGFTPGNTYYTVEPGAANVIWTDAANTSGQAAPGAASNTVSYGQQLFAIQSPMLTTNTIYFGNAVVNSSQINTSINSTSYTGTSNNSLYLGGIAAASIPTLAANNTFTGNNTFSGANNNFQGNIILSSAMTIVDSTGSQGSAGQVLTSNGASNIYWSSVAGGSGGSPGGSNTQIQFNSSGSFGATGGFTFNSTTNTVFIGNSAVSSTINATVYSGTANNSNFFAARAIGSFPLLAANNTFTGNNILQGTTTLLTSNLYVGNTTTSNVVMGWNVTDTSIAEFGATQNSSAEVAIYNSSVGNNASGDLVINDTLGPVGTSNNYIDLGVNGNAFSQSTWTINGPSDGYLYTGNTNLSIGTQGLNYVNFFTGNTLIANERMRITSTGNVGIGNTNPNALLQVTGTANLDSTVYVGGALNFGTANGTSLFLGNSTVNATINSTTYTINNLGISGANLASAIVNSSGIYVGNSTSGGTNFTINIQSNAAADANLIMDASQIIINSGNPQTFINFGVIAGGQMTIGGSSGAGIVFQSGNTTYLNMQGGGNVVVGAANSATTGSLTVQGNCALTAALKANNSYGTKGMVLTTNSTACFWSAPAAAYVTNSAAMTAPANTGTFFMQGLGGNAKLTPARSGNVVVTFDGYLTCPSATAAGDGITWEIYYGTGTAPANAAAVTGTLLNKAPYIYTNPTTITAGDVNIPFSSTAFVAALTVGTAYWFDFAAKSVGAVSTVGIGGINITLREL